MHNILVMGAMVTRCVEDGQTIADLTAEVALLQQDLNCEIQRGDALEAECEFWRRECLAARFELEKLHYLCESTRFG